MTIQVSFFASLSDVFGREEAYQLKEGDTIKSFVATLKQSHPEAEEVLDASRFAVNDVFVEAEHPLNDTDNLLILPPSSGG